MGADQSKPYWHHDGEYAACEVCNSSFSLTRRRHHCRNCGAVCCQNCSFRKCAVPARGFKEPVRVCTSCYITIVTHGGGAASGGAGAGPVSTNGRRPDRNGTSADTAAQQTRPQSPAQAGASAFPPAAASPIPDVDHSGPTAKETGRLEAIVQSVRLADVNQVVVEPPTAMDDVQDTTYEVKLMPTDTSKQLDFVAGVDDASSLLFEAVDVELTVDDRLAAIVGADFGLLTAAIRRLLPAGDTADDRLFAPFSPVPPQPLES